MSQSTKEKLINSAIQIFSQKGFYNTKISDIVQNAGLAQGTFYIYFKSKEDIFMHIVLMIVDQINQTIEKYSSHKDIPEKVMKLFAREIFALLYQYKQIAYIFFFQIICVNEEFQKIYFETSRKIFEFYKKNLQEFPDNEIRADILIGYGKRLTEVELLINNLSYEEIIQKFDKAIEIITGA
ncbi:TetR/AcrR family transcriptional regulator [Persephonella sp.]|uniref:TetR/AcrR family transcriptional regulator n=1 Tax=Persephonella sp. TaxID=2060922 RepID=UPI0026248926|nr:TetR/AcrR family transcriptional regulator [Persephonella sp.]